MAIPRPRYFVRVDGLAASRDLSGPRAQQAADQACQARPDATVELVQVDPTTNREVGSILYQQANRIY